MPLISAAFFVYVCCGGLGPVVTLLDVSSQAFLSPNEKLCSCWKLVGKQTCLTPGFTFENFSLVFSSVVQLQK